MVLMDCIHGRRRAHGQQHGLGDPDAIWGGGKPLALASGCKKPRLHGGGKRRRAELGATVQGTLHQSDAFERLPCITSLAGSGRQKNAMKRSRVHLHKIALEEVLQLPLGCRVGQVANVQAAALGSAGRRSLVGGGLVIGRLGD